MATAVDEGDYYPVPVDARSMEYEEYFEQGDEHVAERDDYTSENTTRLDHDACLRLLLTLPHLRALAAARGTTPEAPR